MFNDFSRAVRLVGFALALCAAVISRAAWAELVVVLNSGEATVTLIDKQTFEVKETFNVGKEPHHLMISPDEKSLIVANAAGNDLTILDPLTGKIQRRVPKIDDPYHLGFSPDQKWFIANGNRLDRVDIYSFDGRDLHIARRVPAAKTPSHLAFTADSKLAFVTLQDSNEVACIELATQTVLWKMKVGPVPAGVWMTPDEKHLLVGITGADYVDVVDWRTQKVVKKIKTAKGAHNFRPMGDRRHVFLSNRLAASISIIDMVTLEKVGDITGLPYGPDDMELTADGSQLWVTCRWSKTVAVIDVPSRTVIRRIPVGRSPHGLYFHSRAPLI